MDLSKKKSCTGKLAYKTEQKAYKVQMRMQRAGCKGVLNVYRCQYCPSWHIGHVPVAIMESYQFEPSELIKPERLHRR